MALAIWDLQYLDILQHSATVKLDPRLSMTMREADEYSEFVRGPYFDVFPWWNMADVHCHTTQKDQKAM